MLICYLLDSLAFYLLHIPFLQLRYLPFFMAVGTHRSIILLLFNLLLISTIHTSLHSYGPQEAVLLLFFSLFYLGLEYIFYPPRIYRVSLYFLGWLLFYGGIWLPFIYQTPYNFFSSSGFYGTLLIGFVLTIIILQGAQDDR
jgi:hypothetical protein